VNVNKSLTVIVKNTLCVFFLYICDENKQTNTIMSFKKQVLKTKDICKATFVLTQDQVKNADTVHIVGEFNDWDKTASPLKKLKNGNFKTTINLVKGERYQFKYIVDGNNWINDDKADLYLSNDFSGENSVIIAE